MIAVRREDARNWPCPWITDFGSAASSRPEPWNLTEAIQYCRDNRTEKGPLAVYAIRGFYQKKVWPKEAQ